MKLMKLWKEKGALVITSDPTILHEPPLNNECMTSRLFALCLNLLLIFINSDFGVLGLKAADRDISRERNPNLRHQVADIH